MAVAGKKKRESRWKAACAYLAKKAFRQRPGKEIWISVLLALLYVWGSAVRMGKSMLSWEMLLIFLLAAFLLRIGVLALDAALSHVRGDRAPLSRRFWILLPVILLLGWLPHYLCNFPGSVTIDARTQLRQALGLETLNNHNPVFDTWLLGLLFRAGKYFFGSDNGGIALVIGLQFLMMSLIFSCAVRQLYEHTRSRLFVAGAVLFYILVPMFGGSGQVVLKDSFHAPLFLLMMVCHWSTVRKPTRGRILAYSLSLLLVSLTRAFAIPYAAVDALALVIPMFRKKLPCRKAAAVCVTAALGLVLLWSEALLPGLGIRNGPDKEKYSLPFQQMGYVVTHRELDEAETIAVESIMKVEEIREKYEVDISDPLKRIYNGANMQLFWDFWRHCWQKYPGDMIRGLMESYCKYIYPPSPGIHNYRATIANCSSIGLDIHHENREANRQISAYAESWEKNPLLVLLMGPGLYCWILLYGMYRGPAKERWKLLSLMTLFLGLFLTPVNGETRYAMPIMMAAPLILASGVVRTAPEAGPLSPEKRKKRKKAKK